MTGLVGWWPLHENSGRANDLSGNGNHGSLKGGVMQGVAGKGGLTAYSFDGNDDQVDLPNVEQYKFQSEEDFTISAWIRAIDDGSYRYIVTYVDNGGSADAFDGWRFVVTNGNQLVWHISDDTNSQTRVDTSSDFIEPSKWYHVCVVHKSGGNTVLYSNGESVDESQTASLNTIDYDSAGAGAFISGRPDGNNLFNGSVNDVRIYNRALSPQEVQALYEWGSSDYTDKSYHDGSDSGAFSRWKFDDNSDTSTATDSWDENQGKVNGANYVDDSVRSDGMALQFGGSDSVDISDAKILGDSVYTLAFWYKTDFDLSGSTNYYLISSSGGTDDKLAVYFNSSDLKVFASDFSSVTFDGSSFVAKEWAHIGLIFDSGNNEINLFHNGYLESKKSVSFTNEQESDLYLGYDGVDEDEYYVGKIDDVRYYSRKLKPSEVFQLYQWGTRGRDMRKLTVNSR